MEQKPFSPKPIEAWDIRGALDSIGIGAANVHFRFNLGEKQKKKMLAKKNVENRVSSDPIQLCWCYFYNSLIRFGNAARENFDLAKKIRLTVDARRAMIGDARKEKSSSLRSFALCLTDTHFCIIARACCPSAYVLRRRQATTRCFSMRVSLCLRNSSLCSVDSRAVIMSKENKSFCSFALASLRVLIRISFLRLLPFLFFALSLSSLSGRGFLAFCKKADRLFLLFSHKFVGGWQLKWLPGVGMLCAIPMPIFIAYYFLSCFRETEYKCYGFGAGAMIISICV